MDLCSGNKLFLPIDLKFIVICSLIKLDLCNVQLSLYHYEQHTKTPKNVRGNLTTIFSFL